MRGAPLAVYSAGVERALACALAAHDGQRRKGLEGLPYAIHPLHVALMLARFGADEEVVQAGLLHDVVEDCDDWTRERVEVEFGPRVAGIVAELTEDKTRGWEERKRAGIDAVPGLSAEAALVKGCDKLHNLESLASDLRAGPPGEVWRSFRGGPQETLTVAAALVEALAPRVPAPLAGALGRAVAALRDLTPA